MSDLVEFLRARLAEDEQAAKLVRQPYRLYVSADGRLAEPLRVDDLHGEHDGEYQQWSDGDDRMPNHVTNWSLVYDPARRLHEIEAKRRIIDRYEASIKDILVGLPGALMDLAAVYDDHPDYCEEWSVT